MIETIVGAIIFIIIIAACCASDSGSSNNTSSPKRNTTVQRSTYDDGDSYSECPSCGAPYYDGYCEECGYPDVNQGWIGEEYG